MPTGMFYTCDECNYTDKFINSDSREFMKKSWLNVETTKIEYSDTLIKKLYCSPACAQKAFDDGVFPEDDLETTIPDDLSGTDWMDEGKE